MWNTKNNGLLKRLKNIVLVYHGDCLTLKMESLLMS